MRLTKYGHSCVFVEALVAGTPQAVLFDPGIWSTVPVERLERLDAICISHGHEDHCDPALLKRLVEAFPEVHITAPGDARVRLQDGGLLQVSELSPLGITRFMSPHEGHEPFLTPPEEFGYHFLETYTHPGDSHSFAETHAVLALPVQAPWGSTMGAVDVIYRLRPRYVLPVHDWHWREEARKGMYDRLEALCASVGVTFLMPADGVPVEVELR